MCLSVIEQTSLGGTTKEGSGAATQEDFAVTQVRRRVKQTLTFEERFQEEVRRFRAESETLPLDSKQRELILQRVRQAERALDLSKWLQSPGRQPPKQLVELS